MTPMRALMGMAADAQRELMKARIASRVALPPEMRVAVARYIGIQLARLDVCAEHLAGLRPANDCQFNPPAGGDPV